MRSSSLRVGVVGAVAVCMLGLVGCSSSSKPASTATTLGSTGGTTGSSATTAATGASASCSSPGFSSTQIQMGALDGLSGVIGTQFDPLAAAVKARIAAQNAAGGIDGREIALTFDDDMGDPATSRSDAQNLVEVKHVFGVIGAPSPGGPGSVPYLASQGVPVTEYGGGTAGNNVYHNFFDIDGYPLLEGGSEVVTTPEQFAISHGGTVLGVLATNATVEAEQGGAQDAAIFKSLGGKVGLIDDVPLSQVNFSADAIRMKSAGVNTLFFVTTTSQIVAFLLALTQAGVNAKVIEIGIGYGSPILQAVGKQIKGAYFDNTMALFGSNSPGMQAYLAAMAKYQPGTVAQQQYAEGGWVSADLMIKGMEAAGPCPTRAGVIAAIRSMTDYTADGLLPGADFALNAPPKAQLCSYWAQVSPDGTSYVPIAGDQPLCGKAEPAPKS